MILPGTRSGVQSFLATIERAPDIMSFSPLEVARGFNFRSTHLWRFSYLNILYNYTIIVYTILPYCEDVILNYYTFISLY